MRYVGTLIYLEQPPPPRRMYLEPNWTWVVNTKVAMTKKCMQEAHAELICLRDGSDAVKGVM
jgi:hypothetical protein